MPSSTDMMSSGITRAAYMREYRKRMRLEDNCNNVPKRTKLHAERQRDYRETYKTYLLNCNIIDYCNYSTKYKVFNVCLLVVAR
jgi:hypothetical protein